MAWWRERKGLKAARRTAVNLFGVPPSGGPPGPCVLRVGAKASEVPRLACPAVSYAARGWGFGLSRCHSWLSLVSLPSCYGGGEESPFYVP
jgi:hypothetical protein